MKCLNLLVVNGQLLVREALSALFRDRIDIRIVGEVGDFGSAMSAACARTVDIVVLDLAVPGLHRFSMIRELRAMQPAMKILVLSTHGDLSTVAAAMAAGASGFLMPECGLGETVIAIRQISAQGRYVSPNIAHDMATQMLRADAHRHSSASGTPAMRPYQTSKISDRSTGNP